MSTTNTEFRGTAVGTACATHSRRGLTEYLQLFWWLSLYVAPAGIWGPMGHHGGIPYSLRPHCYHWSCLDGVAAHPFRQFQQHL